MDNMDKVILTAFTDPMMGLSYESEPVMERLQEEYGGNIELRNVMGLLVRDVSDFMTPEESSMDPEAGISLYCERLATVVDCLPTTHFEIIMKVVRDTGINETAFLRHYQDGSAEAALNEDLAFARRLGIYTLPAYLIQYRDKAVLMQSFEYQDFVDAIRRVME